MTIIPNQYFGIGDVIFCQTLVNQIANGNPIVWPVMPQFVEGLNRAYPHITFVDWRTFKIDYERKDQYEIDIEPYGKCTVLPIRWADNIMKVPYTHCMRAKYDLYGLDYRDWKDKAMWERDKLREAELMLEYDYSSDLETMYPFIFKNVIFGSDCKLKINIKDVTFSGIPTIEMYPIDRFSLFDWAAIIRCAEQIHTVSSSILYMLELLPLQAKEIHLYARKPIETHFKNVDYLFTKPYILHV